MVSEEHMMAYVASYGGGSWSAVPLEGPDLKLSPKEQRFSYGPGCRNNTSHPHETVVLGSHVWVVDLGCDAIYHYNKTEKGLERLETAHVGPGRGPRHMLVIPERNISLVVCELENFLQVHSLDNKTGQLTLKKEVSLVSVKNNAGAEILLHHNRKWVYVSSRGVGTVVVFHLLDNDQVLEKVQEFRLTGTWPRHMSIYQDEDLLKYKWLVVADQMGNHLEILNVNKTDGTLTAAGPVVPTPPGPSWVNFQG